MDLDLAFNLVNFSVLPAWLLLIFLPNWTLTRVAIHSMLYPLILGIVYTLGLGFAVFGGMGAADGGFTTIAGVRALFSTDIGILVGWTHYLLFDLFVGAWIARDACTSSFVKSQVKVGGRYLRRAHQQTLNHQSAGRLCRSMYSF